MNYIFLYSLIITSWYAHSMDMETYLDMQKKYADIYQTIRTHDADQFKKMITDNNQLSEQELGSLLHHAVFCREKSMVRALLKEGADVNAKEPLTGWTPFLRASINYMTVKNKRNSFFDQEIIKDLLYKGADVNVQDELEGHSALHCIVETGNVSMVELLLSYGADPYLKNGDNKTSIDIAQEKGHTQLARLLQDESAIRMLKISHLQPRHLPPLSISELLFYHQTFSNFSYLY